MLLLGSGFHDLDLLVKFVWQITDEPRPAFWWSQQREPLLRPGDTHVQYAPLFLVMGAFSGPIFRQFPLSPIGWWLLNNLIWPEVQWETVGCQKRDVHPVKFQPLGLVDSHHLHLSGPGWQGRYAGRHGPGFPHHLHVAAKAVQRMVPVVSGKFGGPLVEQPQVGHCQAVAEIAGP